MPPLLAKAIGEKLMEYFVNDEPIKDVLKQIYRESKESTHGLELSIAIGTMLEQQAEIKAELNKRIKTPAAIAIGILSSMTALAFESVAPGALTLLPKLPRLN